MTDRTVFRTKRNCLHSDHKPTSNSCIYIISSVYNVLSEESINLDNGKQGFNTTIDMEPEISTNDLDKSIFLTTAIFWFIFFLPE